MEFINYLIDNWAGIVGIAIAFLASVDKVGLMVFKTLRNLMDYYNESFIKKDK